MSRGIYLLANDKVLDNVITLLNSIRCHDKITPISIIPYDDNYQELQSYIQEFSAVDIYENFDFLKNLMETINQVWHDFPKDHRINMLKKFGCWLGPFDEFLYIDTDIVVFNQIVTLLDTMKGYDFLSYDYQRKTGIKDIFKQTILEENLIAHDQMDLVFNAGFFGSRRDALSEATIFSLIHETRKHANCFIWDYYDQGILNYWVIRQNIKQINYTKTGEKIAGNWAGSDYRVEDYQLFNQETGNPVLYLHWAGHKIFPGCRYWDVWNYYRHLNSAIPPYIPPQDGNTTFWQSFKRSLKNLLTERA